MQCEQLYMYMYVVDRKIGFTKSSHRKVKSTDSFLKYVCNGRISLDFQQLDCDYPELIAGGCTSYDLQHQLLVHFAVPVSHFLLLMSYTRT